MRAPHATALAVALVLTPAATARAAEMLSVTVDEANFRAGPSLQHNIVFTAIRYFPVKVIERAKGWVKVEDFEGDQGWIASYLLAKEHTVIVSAERANLRHEPSVDGEVVGTAERTQVYRVVERREHWLKLSADDEDRGWIRDDLVWGD